MPFGIFFVVFLLSIFISALFSQEVLSSYTIQSFPQERFWQQEMDKAKILCQDGGNPIILPAVAYWTFGDSFLGTREDGKMKFIGAVSNSLLQISPGNQSYLTDITDQACHAIPLELPETWAKNRIWPGAGVYLAERTYLFFEVIELTGGGTWDFHSTGYRLACAEKQSLKFNRIADASFPILPHTAIAAPDGYVYLYYVGGKYPDGAAYLARVLAEKIERPASYEFWNGNGFSSDLKQSSHLVPKVYGQVSVAWNPYLERYIMMHVGGVVEDARKIFIRTSPTPSGPFGEAWKVYGLPGTVQLSPKIEGLLYCAYLHPELFQEKGRIMYFTYCVVQDFGTPELVKLELKR